MDLPDAPAESLDEIANSCRSACGSNIHKGLSFQILVCLSVLKIGERVIVYFALYETTLVFNVISTRATLSNLALILLW